MHSILVLLICGLFIGGCKTTSREWQTIPHEKSELTIVSDVFDVSRVKIKYGLENTIETAWLTLGGEKVGFVSQQTANSMYCGYTVQNIWDVFDAEWIAKYRVNTGVQNPNDVKLQSLRNQHGDLYYQDVKGTNQRCIIVAELGLGGSTGVCTGTYLIAGAICRGTYSSGVEMLDKQVFKLMNNLSFIGGKKELIRKSSSKTASRSSGYAKRPRSDEDVCNFAIDHSSKPLKWDMLYAEEFVDEAKSRGLTLDACLKHLDIKTATPEKPSSTTATTKASQPTKDGNFKKRLRELKKLVDDGLVTPDEAAAKRKEILNSL